MEESHEEGLTYEALENAAWTDALAAEANPAEESPNEKAEAVDEMPMEEARPVEEMPQEEETPTEEAVKDRSELPEKAPKDEAEAEAAIKIQSSYRGRQARQRLSAEQCTRKFEEPAEESQPTEEQAGELAFSGDADSGPADSVAAEKASAMSSMASRPTQRVPKIKASKGASADNSAPSTSSSSPRSCMRSPRTKTKQGRSLGVSSPRAKQSPPKSPPKKFITKEDIERIAKPREPPKEVETDANCTFKPVIGENSRKLLLASSHGDASEPRFHTLALKNPEAIQRLKTAVQRRDEAEIAPCTFKPSTNWHDPKSKANEWRKSTSRYSEHIPQRYVKVNEDRANKKKEEEAEASKPSKLAQKSTKKVAQSPRGITVPVPFRSQTAKRQEEREQSQTDLVVDLDDPVFAELHGMLQSLQLSGQRHIL